MIAIQRWEEMVTDDGEAFIAKQIRICDLPDCYFKVRLLEMVNDQGATLWVVGKPGHSLVGDWAAYIGHPMPSYWLPDVHEAMLPYVAQGLIHPEGVCRYGDKLDKETASALFPEYAELTYRP